MEMICQVIIAAVSKRCPNTHVISVDEKTGIQALERLVHRAPKSKGGGKRKEFEYVRRGTTTLMAAVNVENGQLINHHLGPTHKEVDFADFIKATVAKLPEMDRVVILLDQLDTHLSETLVRWIAEEDGEQVGQKGKVGVLRRQHSRRAYLENEHHRVRFLFTPKHCSWLNPIENWFAKLERQVTAKGNFNSVEQLSRRIKQYIVYYNEQLAKPLNWKFSGFNKQRPITFK